MSLKKDKTKIDNLFVVDNINGNTEQVDSFADAWDYIKETCLEDNDIHPDIESIIVVKQVAFVALEDTGRTDFVDGENVPVYKTDLISESFYSLFNRMKQLLIDYKECTKAEDENHFASKLQDINFHVRLSETITHIETYQEK
jgi:hypothetical protein